MQKRSWFSCISLIFVSLFLVAGCANKEVVKKEEDAVQVTKTVEKPKSGAAQETAAAEKAAAEKAAANLQKQKTLQLQSALENIYFNFDSADLSESARSILTKNAEVLMKDSSAKIRIEGNCDERGSAEYNLALGDRRAKSAQKYLATLGVKADRLTTISYGKEKPAVQGSDEAAMSKNRRDEFVVHY